VSELVTVDFAGMLFDMDGVLISSIGSVNRSWRRWAEHYGVPNADTFQVPHGIRATDIVSMLKPDLDVAEGLKFIEDIEMVDVADLKVLPGAVALLKSLPPERWAIVTSATGRLALERLRVAGLPAPERMISAEMVERGKPDPEPYRRGAELIHSPAAECLVVEDAPSGVGAGIAAGCRVLGVLGTHKEAELRAAGATWIVRSLEDVNAQTRPNGLTLSLNVL
jgi:mannitol-1-/sugar-/sorbitol-6-phosphatase